MLAAQGSNANNLNDLSHVATMQQFFETARKIQTNQNEIEKRLTTFEAGLERIATQLSKIPTLESKQNELDRALARVQTIEDQWHQYIRLMGAFNNQVNQPPAAQIVQPPAPVAAPAPLPSPAPARLEPQAQAHVAAPAPVPSPAPARLERQAALDESNSSPDSDTQPDDQAAPRRVEQAAQRAIHSSKKKPTGRKAPTKKTSPLTSRRVIKKTPPPRQSAVSYEALAKEVLDELFPLDKSPITKAFIKRRKGLSEWVSSQVLNYLKDTTGQIKLSGRGIKATWARV